jgi:hypothetical protein
MSNYLRGLGRVVGFSDETERRGMPGDLENDWDNVSRASSYGEANLIRGATNRGPGPQITGGDRMIQQGGGTDQQFPTPGFIGKRRMTGKSHDNRGARRVQGGGGDMTSAMMSNVR